MFFRFSEYGTMLEIRDIQYFADGRSVVDTIGGKRFRVISRGVKDGYNTAKVEYLQDDTVEGNELKGTRKSDKKRVEPSITKGLNFKTFFKIFNCAPL